MGEPAALRESDWIAILDKLEASGSLTKAVTPLLESFSAIETAILVGLIANYMCSTYKIPRDFIAHIVVHGHPPLAAE